MGETRKRKQGNTIQRIRDAVGDRSLSEEFTPRSVNEALGIHWAGKFLPKHAENNPGGNTKLFVRVKRGVYRLSSLALLLIPGIFVSEYCCLNPIAIAQPISRVPQDKELIAVLDLDVVGGSKAEASAVTDRLREEMLRTGRVKLVDRSQLNAIIDEQALQQTGCTAQDCTVRVGRILGVRKIVAGKLTKISEQLWQISAQIIDVESAETLRAESETYQGKFVDFLQLGIEPTARKLLGISTVSVGKTGRGSNFLGDAKSGSGTRSTLNGFGEFLFGMTESEIGSKVNIASELKSDMEGRHITATEPIEVDGRQYQISFVVKSDKLISIRLQKDSDDGDTVCEIDFRRLYGLVKAKYGESDDGVRIERTPEPLRDFFILRSAWFSFSDGSTVLVGALTTKGKECERWVVYRKSLHGLSF